MLFAGREFPIDSSDHLSQHGFINIDAQLFNNSLSGCNVYLVIFIMLCLFEDFNNVLLFMHSGVIFKIRLYYNSNAKFINRIQSLFNVIGSHLLRFVNILEFSLNIKEFYFVKLNAQLLDYVSNLLCMIFYHL